MTGTNEERVKGTIQGLIDRQNQGFEFLQVLGVMREPLDKLAKESGTSGLQARAARAVLDEVVAHARRIYGEEYVFEAQASAEGFLS